MALGYESGADPSPSLVPSSTMFLFLSCSCCSGDNIVAVIAESTAGLSSIFKRQIIDNALSVLG